MILKGSRNWCLNSFFHPLKTNIKHQQLMGFLADVSTCLSRACDMELWPEVALLATAATWMGTKIAATWMYSQEELLPQSLT